MIVNVYLGILFLKDAAFDEDKKSWTEEIISQSLNDSLIFVTTNNIPKQFLQLTSTDE